MDLYEFCRSLKFGTPDELKKWCIENDLKYELNTVKRITAIKEKRIYQLQMQRLKKTKKRSILDKLCSSIKDRVKSYDLYCDIALYLESVRCKFIQDDIYQLGLASLLNYKEYWVNDYNTWKPTSHNIHKQFSSFIKHVLMKYKTPEFLEQAFSGEKMPQKSQRYLHQLWYIDLTSGTNPRQLIEFPKLTKKQAHIWLQTPADVKIEDSFLYAKIIAEKGTPRLFEHLKNTVIKNDEFQSDDDFVLSIIKFFITSGMFDYSLIPQIMDYIYNQKFVPDIHAIRQKTNFTLKGRTMLKLIQKSDEWHTEVRRINKKTKGFYSWNPRGYEVYEEVRGKVGNQKIYRITELVCSKELIDEGRKLKHCVASYASGCFKGQTSIHSLWCESPMGNQKMVTIEVRKGGVLGQMSGSCNRRPEAFELEMIHKWCRLNNISI